MYFYYSGMKDPTDNKNKKAPVFHTVIKHGIAPNLAVM